MAYVRPGVEVRQVQKSQTPVLITPDLEGCIVGNGYWWQELGWDNPGDVLRHSLYDGIYDGIALDISLSGINSQYHDVLTADENLVLVDLLGISGPDTGQVTHLKNAALYDGGDFSVNSNVITISGMTTTSTYLVRAGFRAKREDTLGFHLMSSMSDIEETFGEIVSWNPLTFGLYVAMINASRKMYALNIDPEEDQSEEVIGKINDVLSLKEVYAIAPVTHKVNASDLITHANTYSEPEMKKERIFIYNGIVSYEGGDPTSMSSTQRNDTAEGIRDTNAAYQAKRLVSTHPDVAYVMETRHISTISPAWVTASFTTFTTQNFETYGPYCKFVADIFIGTTKYKAGQNITTAIWETLLTSDWGGKTGMVTVYAPVPGFYFNAMIAGQAIGTTPEQPLTNVPGAGLKSTFGSQDLFSEADLNIMAEGGTYILTQDTDTSPIYSRHQMTTDITSIAKRELSIVKAIDYTAKFVRKALKPFIGRFNITPSFIALVNTILVGVGNILVRDVGVLNDFKTVSVYQDPIAPDTLRAEIEVLPKYPVNYIKVTLVF